jgi:hypothetical protein
MPDRIRVDASDLRKVAKIAKAFSPELQKQLRKQVRAAAGIGAKEVQSAIRDMPSKGEDDHDLRELIAKAVSVSFTTGTRAQVSIRVRRSAALERIGAGGIAKAINLGRWRHPLFGNRDYWYTQTGFEFFEDRIQPKKPEMTALIRIALDDAARIAAERGYL